MPRGAPEPPSPEVASPQDGKGKGEGCPCRVGPRAQICQADAHVNSPETYSQMSCCCCWLGHTGQSKNSQVFRSGPLTAGRQLPVPSLCPNGLLSLPLVSRVDTRLSKRNMLLYFLDFHVKPKRLGRCGGGGHIPSSGGARIGELPTPARERARKRCVSPHPPPPE